MYSRAISQRRPWRWRPTLAGSRARCETGRHEQGETDAERPAPVVGRTQATALLDVVTSTTWPGARPMRGATGKRTSTRGAGAGGRARYHSLLFVPEAPAGGRVHGAPSWNRQSLPAGGLPAVPAPWRQACLRLLAWAIPSWPSAGGGRAHYEDLREPVPASAVSRDLLDTWMERTWSGVLCSA